MFILLSFLKKKERTIQRIFSRKQTEQWKNVNCNQQVLTAS